MDHTMRLKSALLRYASLLPALLPALLAPSGLLAQTGSTPLATPSVQIIAPVTGDSLVTLKGNTHPLAQARYDQGAVSPSLATGRMQLLLRRSPAQAETLREYMGQLQNPNSPNYRKWLTPSSYGANFGISDQDLQTVEAWLTSQGFKVEAVPASRNLIQFSGTTGQVAQAFHTSIHTYVVNGETHHSNASDPEIPAALAPVVAGISPMNDFRAKAQHVLRGTSTVSNASGSLQVVGHPTPQLTVTDPVTGGPFLFVTPSDAATIYNAPNSLNRSFSGTALYGTGVKVGVAEYSDLQTADYQNYRNLFLPGITAPAPNLIVDGADPGVTLDGDGQEALLDAEVISGLAPAASLYFYSSASDILDDGLSDAIVRAIEDNEVSVLSVSYGSCEAELGSSGNTFFFEYWQQAAAQGITPLVAAGDNGSAACDDATTGNVAVNGLQVNGIASTPYDIAVGGTDFNVLGSNFTQYATASNVSPDSFYGSALGYIPENPWNDSIKDPVGAFSANVVNLYPDMNGGTDFSIIVAGSGGASSAGVCTATSQNGICLSPGYPTPPFQSGINVGTAAPSGVRYLPDVSLFAAPGKAHPVAWAFCSDSSLDQATTASYTDCLPGSNGFNLDPIGGTSAATPAVAGILGLVIQSLPGNPRLGIANDVLYNLNAKGNTGAFNDVTVGNNSVPCSPVNSAGCGSNGFLTGYNAGTGYDLATGLGSINIAKLITAWPTATFTASQTAFQINGATAAINIVHGTAVNLQAQVTPNNATGVVSVTGNPGAGNEAAFYGITLASGSGSLTGVNTLPGGTYTLQAYFPGSVLDAASTSNAIQVTVTPEGSQVGLSTNVEDPVSGQTAQNAISETFGQNGAAYVAPENLNGTSFHGSPSGTATLTINGSASPATSLNSNGAASFPLYNLAPGTYALSASYSGDSSYGASATPGNLSFAVGKGPTQLTIIPGGSAIAGSGMTAVNVYLLTDSVSNTYPTGAVTLTSGSTTLVPTSVTNIVNSNGTDLIQYTYAVAGTQLAQGANTLQAAYAGDSNYTGAGTTTTMLAVSGSTTTPAFNMSGPNGGLLVGYPGAIQTGTISIASTSGFSSAVNLTCSVQAQAGTTVTVLPSCTVAPTSVTPAANGTATTVLTVNTTVPVASLNYPQMGNPRAFPFRRFLAAGGGIALSSLLLWGIPSRRRSWRSMMSTAAVLLVLFAVGAFGLMGCGGSSNSTATGTPAPPPTGSSAGTATGSYLVTVTGTSGSLTVNTQVNVTVQ